MQFVMAIGGVRTYRCVVRALERCRRWGVTHRLRSSAALTLALASGALAWLPNATVQGRVVHWWALLPPVVALVLVVAFGRVVVALGLSVLAGSILLHGPSAGLTVGVRRYVWDNASDPWHLMVCGFALSVLSMIKVIERTGAFGTLVSRMRRYVDSPRAVKLGALGAGLVVFFDDYANAFLVGSGMRPLADRHRVSREKLAYIVDSTAAPVAGVAIVSTWLSYEVGLLSEITAPMRLGVEAYGLLLLALPLRFYCLFALGLVFLTSYMGRDFGPMLRAERAARAAVRSSEAVVGDTGEASRGQDPTLVVAVVPVVILVCSIAVGLFIDGGGFDGPFHPLRVSEWQRVLAGVRHSAAVLFTSALLALASALILASVSARIAPAQLWQAVLAAWRAGLPALGILFCAWALSAVGKELGSGPYLVAVLADRVPVALVPVLTFVGAAIVALSTGTSWGTMAIVMPAALPLAHDLGGVAVLVPTVAAVLDGAIFGDHCSPVSDTTVLSATAVECDLVAHVWTQVPYAMLAMVVAALSYGAVSLGVGGLLCLVLGVVAMATVLRIWGKLA